jgi:hypothetical protein
VEKEEEWCHTKALRGHLRLDVSFSSLQVVVLDVLIDGADVLAVFPVESEFQL